MPSSAVLQYPPELLFIICGYVYSSSLLPSPSSLDPLILKDYGVPTSLPSTVPASHWSEPVARRTLSNLCLVNHAWYAAAKPWLWTKLEVRLPRSWLSVVEEIAWEYDEGNVNVSIDNTPSEPCAFPQRDNKDENSFEDQAPDSRVDPDLLSPIVTRDPSPRRFRPKSKSPARWKFLQSINNAIRRVTETDDLGLYVPTLGDPHPGRFVRHLDFNHFRTIGMRRSIDEGVKSRFVTGDRVRAVLREMPNLAAFGATEYMDGALTLPVLQELFLRGTPSGGRGRPLRCRGSFPQDFLDQDAEEEERERRRECRELEAVDLTGCVSGVFVNALTEFVNTHLLASADPTPTGGGPELRSSRTTRFLEDPLSFPGLKRLGLRGVKSITPRILASFVMAFPSLTHLDLSGTRASPELLYSLGRSPTVRLQSLALARCVKLTSASIRDFLVNSNVTSRLKELNLYGDMTFASPLTEDDLRDILNEAPCFHSGDLVYLDLSSTPLTKDLLKACCAQPNLRSLGLSHIPDLELKDIMDFLKSRASNVEILTLIGTSPDLDCGLRAGAENAQRRSPRQASIALHARLIRPLCTPPFSFSLTGALSNSASPPTRLRVIELSTLLLGGIGAGAGAWRIIRSKGGRGWYVDTASAWVAQPGSGQGSVLRRDLAPEHAYRAEMDKLSQANGNVSSGVGWHARKMEILHGCGMLGREDGLYGAVSFAYQG